MSTHNRPDSTSSAEGSFLSRWSRRKSQARQPGDAPAHDAAPPTVPTAAPTLTPAVTPVATPVAARAGAAATSGLASAGEAAQTAGAVSAREAEAIAPPPTLDDVAQLDADSDYRRFAARDVDPSVRNAAMKKLFHSAPHFNVMDGLDVYIDDYNSAAPLPKAMLRNLLQARVLGLIDDELKEQERPEDLLAAPQAVVLEVDALGTEGAQALSPAPTAAPADPETPPLPTAHPDSADPA